MDSHRDTTKSHPASGRPAPSPRGAARSAQGEARSHVTLRRMLLGAIVLVLAQVAVGMVVIGITVRALRSRRPPVAAWTTLASLLVVGAGFNGASFLNSVTTTSAR